MKDALLLGPVSASISLIKGKYRSRLLLKYPQEAFPQKFLKEEVALPNINTRVITVSEVRMSPDLKHAKVFFMPLGGKNSEFILQSLINNNGLIKKQMSRNWKNKFLPNLHFVLDESFDYAEKIEKLIIKTHEND